MTASSMSAAAESRKPQCHSRQDLLRRNSTKSSQRLLRKTLKDGLCNSRSVISIGTRFTAFSLRRSVAAPLARSCPQQVFEAAEWLRARAVEAARQGLLPGWRFGTL